MQELNKINNPEDLKRMDMQELRELSNEIRQLLINKVSITGGHMGPNLGIIEATIALHYVFNSPIDKIVFDVSHQCYTHKILAGRKENYIDKDKYNEVSGFTAPKESIHDIFQVGHTSTSVSLATGLAIGRNLTNKKENIIAVIGDGSLSGGEAFEGLNNAANLDSNLIIIVNDNEMSIAENQGGMYKNLKLLRDTRGTAKCNIFKSLGLDYIYVEEGNNVEVLIENFKKVKDINHPIVVHIHTLKGKGMKEYEEDKESGHYVSPKSSKIPNGETYGDIIAEYIKEKAKDTPVFAVTAATPKAVGLTKEFRDNVKENHYVDVGIAEEHAVAMISGAAKNGAKPIFVVASTFIQRAYDQLLQDLALNNSPATIVVSGGGLSSSDATHVGAFDIPLISNIPNMVYFAPTTKEEYIAMLDYSISQNEHPVAVRVPSKVISTGIKDTTDYSELNKFKLARKGEKIAIIAAGSMYELGERIANKLTNATLINPIFLTGLDLDLLNDLKQNHNLVITLEDGVLDGGFGEKISRFYSSSNMKVINYGGKKEFLDRVSMIEIINKNRLREDLILEDITNCIGE